MAKILLALISRQVIRLRVLLGQIGRKVKD